MGPRLGALVAILGIATFLAAGVGPTARASHGSTPGVVDFMSIDVDPSATPANAPLSLGTREICRSVAMGSTFTVDLTIDEVDISDRVIVFGAMIRYNASVLNLLAVDVHQMLEGGGGAGDASDGDLPDTDGSHYTSAYGVGPLPSSAEYGSGVLARLTLKAVGGGGSQIAIHRDGAVIVNKFGNSLAPVTLQAGAVGVNQPNPCGDNDSDGIPNAADNCPIAEPLDYDGDALSDSCDPDDDGDGAGDMDESTCGADPANSKVRPERTDLAGDDDGDGMANEPLPAAASSRDCDGDGYMGAAEDNVFGAAARADQDPCGTNAWPADFVSGGMPDSTNRITITDFTSFLAPVRHFNTSPNEAGFDLRWDLVPGAGVFSKQINITDLTADLIVAPPMLNGTRALSGPPCPWTP